MKMQVVSISNDLSMVTVYYKDCNGDLDSEAVIGASDSIFRIGADLYTEMTGEVYV